jgi:threonine/homoserine/homoserine lactone efflux protein
MTNSPLLFSLIGFAFVASITPGPNNLLLMSSGALFGWRRTLPHLGGVLVGFAVLMSCSIFGLGAAVQQWPWLITVVKTLGASWLVWLSLKFFRIGISRPTDLGSGEAAPIGRPFRFYEAVFFQWINPKALVATISSAGAFIAIADSPYVRALIIVGIFFAAGAVSCTSWMMAGDTLNRLLASGSKSSSWINLGMGLLILLTALYIVLA